MMQIIRTITNKTDRKRSTEIDESKSNRDSTTSSVLQKGQHEHSDIEKLADNAADDNTTVASSDKPGEVCVHSSSFEPMLTCGCRQTRAIHLGMKKEERFITGRWSGGKHIPSVAK